MKFSLRALSLSASLFFASAVANAQSAAVHGMVLFGSDQLYVSHIPMYMTPHDHQALAKVSISATGLAAYERYNKGGQQYFTIAPRPFVLPQMLNGTLKSFQADIHRGSFEQGGPVIASGVTVTVESIEYQSRLSRSTAPLRTLQYLTVDDGENSFLAHKITAPNNFDHIVQIKWLNKKSDSSNVVIDNSNVIKNDSNLLDAIPSDSLKSFAATDRISSRLQVGQLFSVAADGSIEESTSADTASFQVVSDFYCTQGPDFYNPCD